MKIFIVKENNHYYLGYPSENRRGEKEIVRLEEYSNLNSCSASKINYKTIEEADEAARDWRLKHPEENEPIIIKEV